MKQIFDRFPDINVSGFARRIGMNETLMRQYACGRKPSEKQRKRIIDGLHELGRELFRIKC